MNKKFRLDRGAFAAMTVEEADHRMSDYKNLSARERLEIANYLNSIAYDYPLHNPPKMEKVFFGARSLKNG